VAVGYTSFNGLSSLTLWLLAYPIKKRRHPIQMKFEPSAARLSRHLLHANQQSVTQARTIVMVVVPLCVHHPPQRAHVLQEEMNLVKIGMHLVNTMRYRLRNVHRQLQVTASSAKTRKIVGGSSVSSGKRYAQRTLLVLSHTHYAWQEGG
jgi:hypothetical protein